MPCACDEAGEPADAGGDSDVDSDSDSDSGSSSETISGTGSETDVPSDTGSKDCWAGIEIRSVPDLCEQPCTEGGENCALEARMCVQIDACPVGARAVCATAEELCAANGCEEPCCSMNDGVPSTFTDCGSGCC